MFFSLSSWELGLLIFVVIGGACAALGVLAGRYMRAHSDRYREPIGALQGALLGVVGLILAFGLSLAVGRYQDRRAHVVHGRKHDRHCLSAGPNPSRSRSAAPSLALLRKLQRPRDSRLTYEVPGGAAIRATSVPTLQGRLPMQSLAACRPEP